MVGIAVLSGISGFLLGLSIGFIIGYGKGKEAMREWFEKKLATHPYEGCCIHHSSGVHHFVYCPGNLNDVS